MSAAPPSSGKPVSAFFDDWCETTESKSGKHHIRLLSEKKAGRLSALKTLKEIIPNHYFNPELVEARLQRLGWEKSARAIRKAYPKTKRARSGDLGEILATEYVDRKMIFRVPIYRLRWKDGRELALRGDDIIAVRIDEKNTIHFLKGEAKSRKAMSKVVIEEALDALANNYGRPSPHSLNFVVAQLFDLKDPLWEKLDEYVTSSEIPVKRVTHFLFTLSGNDPETMLTKVLGTRTLDLTCAFVSVIVDDHATLVASVFEDA